VPKITASSVAEHVARQEQRIFDTAIDLFTSRGYANVTFADIAEAVGLARNSLYRYFPGKADILMRWFRSELEARIVRAGELLGRDGDPARLVDEWVDDQLDYATRPEHVLMASMTQVEPALAVEARAELFGVHSRLLAPLSATLARAGVPDEALAATSELINGLVLSAARFEAANGSPDATVRARAHRAIAALVP
jgi:AcrR family transcriptional regulator